MLRSSANRLALLAVATGFLITSTTSAFADEGVATWYGPGFQGNVMASGQIYDMYDPTTTAANIFPFGTWVKVTNLANGKSVVVQVRDRGPFKHALDLSYAAFALLDDPKKMSIRVQYEVVPGPGSGGKEPTAGAQPQPAPAPSPSPSPPKLPSPAPSEVKPAAPSPAPTSYVVAPGDTLTAIANRFGVSTQALIKINDLTRADSILIGQVIKLKDDQPARAEPSAGGQGAPGAAEPKLYIVQSGETLNGIAERFGTTAERLLAFNDISDPDLVRVGDQLRLSPPPSKPDRGPAANAMPAVHVVQSGETLSQIALQYGLSEKSLAELNDLVNIDQIVIGQELQLAPDRASEPAAYLPGSQDYTVQDGDTLFGIALEHGTTVEAMVALNGLENENLLLPGQILRLP